MNTKGIKFLAVLAVLAFAFAAFAVVSPAETEGAAPVTTPAYYSPGVTDEKDTGTVTSTDNEMDGSTLSKYVVTGGSATIKAVTGAAVTVYVPTGTTLTVGGTLGMALTVIPVAALTDGEYHLSATSGVTVTYGAAAQTDATFKADSVSKVTLGGTAAITTGTVPAGMELVISEKVTLSGALDNNGTISIYNETKDKAVLTLTGSADVKSTGKTGKIVINSESSKESTRPIQFGNGTIQNQTITVKDKSDNGAWVKVNGTMSSGVVIKNNTINLERPNCILVKDITGAFTVEISGNTFTSSDYVDQLILVAGTNTNATILVKTNDISGIKGFEWEKPNDTNKKYGKAALEVQVASSVGTVDSTTSGVTIKTDIESIGARGVKLTVTDTMSFDYLGISKVSSGGSMEVATGKTLTVKNMNIGADSTATITGTLKVTGTVLDEGTLEVAATGAIQNNGILNVVKKAEAKASTESVYGTNGIIGTGITYVKNGGELILGLAGNVATGSMLMAQDMVVYEGAKVKNNGPDTASQFYIINVNGQTAPIVPSTSSGSGYVSIAHASDFATSQKMVYSIYGAYTITDNAGAKLMNPGHTVNVLSDSAITIAGSSTFYVVQNGILNVYEGATIELGSSADVVNDGTINFASLSQVFKLTNNGTVNVAGEAETIGTSDATTVTETVISEVGKDVVVLTGQVTTVAIPADKKVVIIDPSKLETITIKSGAEAGMTLDGTQTSAITVSNNDSAATGYGTVTLSTKFTGTIEFSYGSVYINGVEISGTITAVSGTVKIEGSIDEDKDLTIEASSEATILVEEGKSLEIPLGSTLKLKGSETAALKMNNDGQITGSGTIDVNYYSQFYTSKPVSVSFSGSGKIIIDDGTENVYLSGTYTSQNSYNATQNVIVDGNLTIMKDASIIIEGGLEVREGVTITIQEGGFLLVQSPTAYVDIYGTVKSASAGVIPFIPGFTIAADVDGDVNIYGSIVASKTATGGETTVAIYGESMLTGTMTVNNNAVAAFGELTISEQGVLTVNGAISGTLYNESVVNFSGSVDTAMLIYMAADGATVQIDALYNGTLGITDVGMYLGKIDGNKKYVDDSYAYVNKVTFANIGGVTVTEKIGSYTYQGTKVLYNTTSIDGSVSVADKKSATDPLMEVVNGTISASGDLKILQAQVNVRGHSADDTATLSVSGTAFVDNTAYKTDVDVGLDIQANGKLSVSGSLISKEVSISDESRINAVAYSYTENTITYYVYSNLGYAIESGIKDLTVLGDLMVSTSTTVPAGYDIDASGKKVTIGNTMYEGYNEVELIIKDGASLSAGSIVVNGTLAVEVADTGLVCSNITSDVYSSDDVSALYTNIYTALAAADAGDVVKITNKNNIVYIEKNVTIKEGATLLIPASKTLGIVEGYTLTVYGTLQNKGTIAAYTEEYVVDPSGFAETAEAKKYAAISVYGIIESMTDMTYDNYKIPGAYFEYKTLKYITSIANSDDMISIAADDTIDIYGKKLEFGSVEYVGTEAEPVVINIHGAIVSGTIAINAAEINIDNGLSIDATFKGITGSITFVGVMTSAASKIVAAVEDDVALLEITKGEFDRSSVTMEDRNRKTTFDGIVAVDGDAKIVLYKPVVKGTLGLSGAVDISGTTSVSGSLIIDNEAVVKAGSNVTVTGSLVALEATTTGKAAGKMVMDNGKDAAVLYVGGSSSLFDSTKTGKQTTSAEAAVTGDVKANHYVAFPGSTFEGKITEYLKVSAEKSFYTDFYVEDILFVTIYDDADIADEARSVIADYAESTTGTGYTAYYWVPADLEDCIFDAWQYKSSGEYKDITATAGKPVTVGKYAEVYASIDYYIYTVTIYTDAGVKSVSIDGVELYNAANNRFVTFEPILAGNHKVTYTLKNGYEGTPVLSTSTGTVLKDNTFGVNGTDVEDLYVNFQLIGTEPIPEPEPEPTPTPEEKSEWTVTTILLCVLVVLIAIMAVIVALRLNRN